jgi:ABC-type amino acid transport substrate-binding protein
MTDYTQLLLNLATGKADVALIEPIIADGFISSNSNSIENISSGKPIRIFPNCWMFNRGEYEFKAMLDTVLDEVINSGAMDKIISKYEKAPNQLYRVALPYQPSK